MGLVGPSDLRGARALLGIVGDLVNPVVEELETDAEAEAGTGVAGGR